MKSFSILFAAVFASANARNPSDRPFGRCQVSSSAPPHIDIQPAAFITRGSHSEFIHVDVHFHIASTVNDTNLIHQGILDAQWKVLQEAYVVNNINLSLNSTDRIVSDRAGQYFIVDESTGEFPNYVNYEEERNQYLSSTRKGGYDALNIYFFSRYLPGATGYCSFPTLRNVNDTEILGLDGCAVSGLTMPGITVAQGGFEEYNMGHVAVHEAGHWFGLNHTFVGSCNSPTGDLVSDTPAQLSEIYGCPVGSDSCPDSDGVDPIDNYMGYTDDVW